MSKLTMMVGLVASGKSTVSEQISKEENTIILSSDILREKLFGDINIQDGNNIIFDTLHKLIKYYLQKDINVTYDATNIDYKKRMELLNSLKDINCYKECVFVATPYEKCLEQNSKRDRKVPEYVITKMYKNIYIPQYYEGFDNIKIVWNFNEEDKQRYKFSDIIIRNNISQDNPHHTLSVSEHCVKCSEILRNQDELLQEAGLWHDVGKPFCKEFKNSKGETTDIAHYFQHHLVSAYYSLFGLKTLGVYNDSEILLIANYIQWHMQMFFTESEKSKNKFVKLVGQEFYDKLSILHDADINAK